MQVSESTHINTHELTHSLSFPFYLSFIHLPTLTRTYVCVCILKKMSNRFIRSSDLGFSYELHLTAALRDFSCKQKYYNDHAYYFFFISLLNSPQCILKWTSRKACFVRRLICSHIVRDVSTQNPYINPCKSDVHVADSLNVSLKHTRVCVIFNYFNVNSGASYLVDRTYILLYVYIRMCKYRNVHDLEYISDYLYAQEICLGTEYGTTWGYINVPSQQPYL